MAEGRFVSYLRVSTARQGESGLGREAQLEAVAQYLNGGNHTLLDTFEETESGKCNDRPELAKALRLCRKKKATLIVAKLDRLARDTEFLLRIVRESGEGGVVFCDLKDIPAGPVGKFMITQLASVATLEAGFISQRTKAALAAAKARGKKLGGRRVSAERFAEIAAEARQVRSFKAAKARSELQPLLREIQAAGATTLRQIATELNERDITAPRGGEWSAVQVHRVLGRSAQPRKEPASVGTSEDTMVVNA